MIFIKDGSREIVWTIGTEKVNWKKFYKNFGELCPEGMRMHYILGKIFRKKYIEEDKLLSPKFNHSEIYIRSTDLNR